MDGYYLFILIAPSCLTCYVALTMPECTAAVAAAYAAIIVATLDTWKHWHTDWLMPLPVHFHCYDDDDVTFVLIPTYQKLSAVYFLCVGTKQSLPPKTTICTCF